VLRVSDTGIGIPHAEQEKLFTRFFRSSLAQERAIPGSGLGLSIAHAIVEKHGGTMTVESEPGEGTTFQVRLPVL
jgi:signal transduction histidine kinase